MPTPEPIVPQPGQESVWDYPRPPRLETVDKLIQIIFNGEEIARTQQAKRVLETSHAPVYYIPIGDIRQEFLRLETQSSYCEWKGIARYYSLQVNDRKADLVGWCYPDPLPPFKEIANHIAFYAQKMDACIVNSEIVIPQPGGFYGGWITKDIVGPFKGVPGSMGW